jgi:hypothetical protein
VKALAELKMKPMAMTVKNIRPSPLPLEAGLMD